MRERAKPTAGNGAGVFFASASLRTAMAQILAATESSQLDEALRAAQQALDAEMARPASSGATEQATVASAWLDQLAAIRRAQLAELARLRESVARLSSAEQAQRALYSLAEQSASDGDLDHMLRGLHAIVGSLVCAENFFIALYDETNDTVRFPYYADSADSDPPRPDSAIALEQMRHGLAWMLLRGGRPLIGSHEQLARQPGGDFRPHGPIDGHLLGVPLLRGERVVGCIAIQTYRTDTAYTQDELDLLTHVAQRVQAVLEKRETQAELERRVADRTAALRESNRLLRQQVLQRQHGERLQAALFRIAELTNTSETVESFYAAVHRVLGGLLYARNFYIALLEEDGKTISFPYSVDENDAPRHPRKQGRGATEYVIRRGKPLLADRAEFERLAAAGEIAQSGARSVCWLGVPLIWTGRVLGVLVVQSYSPDHVYGPREQELLTFVSFHIANALQRKHSSTTLQRAYADLGRRVDERTRALALANRDLREQIAERERVERRLKYETLHDSLTGLPNRTLLLQRLGLAMQRHQDNPREQFAVLFIDLDRFKVINDSVGHLVGDDLLFQAGGRIRACLKTSDVVARLGGDEFAVLAEGIVDAHMATQIAEHIIGELQAPFRLGIKEIFTSASIGIAMAAPHYHRPEELLRDADTAMYRAKSEGRQRSALFDDRMRREALSLLEMEGDLRRALSRHEFVPFYQPIVTLQDGRTVGYEALLRWRHPERGMLLPGDFLAVAEENGSAELIDWQIFRQVIPQIPRLAGADGFVSINVSGRHFRAPDLDARLLALLHQHQVTPTALRIEVTERALLENPDQVKRILGNLRWHGCGVALDDFGTGYSSLSYLHRYPITKLKIDRSFVIGLDHHSPDFTHSLAVVRAIKALADTLSIQVIAEGIENADQRETLRSLGLRYGQGFLFAKPQPIEHWLPPPEPPDR